MRKILTLFSMLIAGLATMAWTGVGESSDPMLADREIPVAIVTHCASSDAGQLEACRHPEFTHRWVGRTEHGDLFVVMNEACAGSGCQAWLLQKDAGTVSTLLTFDKTFRVHASRGGYPVIETYTELSPDQDAYSRFEWNGSSYARTASRLVFSVDGMRCGTREECNAAAREALRQQRVDRAVKIWENVHGVSWI